MNPSDIHLIQTAPALVAALPAIHGSPIPTQTLVLMQLTDAPGEWSVTSTTSSHQLDFDAHDLCNLLHRPNNPAPRALAIIIDAECDGPDDRPYEHARLLDRVESHFALAGVALHAAYAAKGTTTGYPVWSIDAHAHLGTVPTPDTRHTPTSVYLLPRILTVGPPDQAFHALTA